MKSNIQILIAIILMLVMRSTIEAQAQVPQLFNYQGIARDAKGNPLSNQSMALKLSVMPTSDATEAEYEETQLVSTNEFGLYTLQIGNGAATTQKALKDVKWETGNKYIKVAIDPNGGSNFVDLGTNQLLSVPYAIYADRAGMAANAGNDKTRSGAVNSDASYAVGTDAHYLTKFHPIFNEISKSNLYQSPLNGKIGWGTTSPSGNFSLHTAAPGVIEHIRMQDVTPTGAGRFTMYNDVSASYATFTKYGTVYAGGYPGISVQYPYANLLAFGNNGVATNDGRGRTLISSGGNIGISLAKGGTSKLKFHADFQSENVGIGGNAIPVSRVHLNNTDSSIMTVRVTNSATGHTANDGLLITQTGNAADIMNKENSSLMLGTNNNPEITIVAAGNVGVNTTSPSATIQLDVNGSGSATGIRATADQQAGATNPIFASPAADRQAIAVHGVATATTVAANGTNIGVAGSANSTITNNCGVYGESVETPNRYNSGVIGKIKTVSGAGFLNVGVGGEAIIAPNSWAGYFTGNANVTGQIQLQTGAAAGYILQSNASGMGSWVDPCTLPCISGATANEWHVTGNTVTSAGKYLGTNDDFPLQFKINSSNAGYLSRTPRNSFYGYDAGSANFANAGIGNTGVGNLALRLNTTGDYNTAIGDASMQANTAGQFNEAHGFRALYSNTIGSYNAAFGSRALNSNTIGNENVAVGHNSLESNSTGSSNVSVGMRALFSNVAGSKNVAIGDYAMYNTTTGGNVAIGSEALTNNTTGIHHTAIGTKSLFSNTTGTENIAVGENAMMSNTTGSENTAFGMNTLLDNVTGNWNTAVGHATMENNVSGSDNVAVGNAALQKGTATNHNTAVGIYSLQNNTADNNTALGWYSLLNNTTGNNNTAVGVNAMNANSTGSFNVALGAEANVGANTTNGTAIGSKAYAPTDNTVILGSISGVNGAVSNTRIGMGTTAPTSTLHVAGSYSHAWNATGGLPIVSGNVYLGDLDHVYNIVNGGIENIVLPSPLSCPYREYVIINQNGAPRNITAFWDFDASIKVAIPPNSSITVMAVPGGSWNRIR
nr:hypothetical protein [Chitinophagaceae bacterium]